MSIETICFVNHKVYQNDNKSQKYIQCDSKNVQSFNTNFKFDKYFSKSGSSQKGIRRFKEISPRLNHRN